MRRSLVLVSAMCWLIARSGGGQTPPGFSWVNLESDKATMAAVRHAIHDSSITAFREVGVKDGFALVMAASRDAEAPTPDYDRWSIYNVSLKTGASRILGSGYGVKLFDWIGNENNELPITYYDCWECEAATLFTTLRFKKNVGWRARWPNTSNAFAYPQPGVPVATTDIEDDDNEFDLVFALIARPDGTFLAGSWQQTRDTKTGKVDDDIERYSVDPTTKEDRVEKLEGRSAVEFEHQICTQSSGLIQPSSGQDSKACKHVLAKRTQNPHP